MPLRNKVPRTTHQWLKPLYNYLDALAIDITPSGASGPNGVWLGSTVTDTMISNATGIIGMYGATGIGQPSGVGSTGSAAGGGATGSSFFDFRTNGGTGTNYYTLTDIVNILKRRGDIAQ